MTGLADSVKGAAGGLNGGMFDDVEDAAKSAFKGVLFEGMKVSDALRQSFANMLQNKANSLFDSAWSGIWSGITGLFGFANGGAFSNGRLTAFASGGVVTGPTVFPMANGAGLMGEAGPEAIMPLTRMRNGKLGVASGGGAAQQVVIHVQANDYFDARVANISSYGDAQTARMTSRAMPGAINDMQRRGTK